MSTARAAGNGTQAAGPKVRLIGFRKRLFAALIDGLLIAFGTFVIMLAVGVLAMIVASYNPYASLHFGGFFVILALLLSLVYLIGSWRQSGQTIGKSTMSIMVVGQDGKPPSAGKAVLRYIGYLVSGAVLSLGFLWITLDKKRQGWHDKIAGTYVIDADDPFDDATQVEFVQTDKEHGWVWWAIWLVFALFLPSALLAGLWILSPLIPRAFNALLGG